MTQLDWQPISTAPKDDREILLWSPHHGLSRGEWDSHNKLWLISASDKEWAWDSTGCDIQQCEDPTHWANIPKGPLP